MALININWNGKSSGVTKQLNKYYTEIIEQSYFINRKYRKTDLELAEGWRS